MAIAPTTTTRAVDPSVGEAFCFWLQESSEGLRIDPRKYFSYPMHGSASTLPLKECRIVAETLMQKSDLGNPTGKPLIPTIRDLSHTIRYYCLLQEFRQEIQSRLTSLAIEEESTTSSTSIESKKGGSSKSKYIRKATETPTSGASFVSIKYNTITISTPREGSKALYGPNIVDIESILDALNIEASMDSLPDGRNVLKFDLPPPNHIRIDEFLMAVEEVMTSIDHSVSQSTHDIINGLGGNY